MPSEQKDFTCPKCNSGHGRYIRAYTTQGQKRKSSSSVAPPKVEIRAQYVTKQAFKKHVKACHIHNFKKPQSDVYECCYCPCGGFKGFIRCNAVHPSEEDMMNYLAKCHSRG
jgi:hypothetical protein